MFLYKVARKYIFAAVKRYNGSSTVIMIHYFSKI
jgi:hypothetical protein